MSFACWGWKSPNYYLFNLNIDNTFLPYWFFKWGCRNRILSIFFVYVGFMVV